LNPNGCAELKELNQLKEKSYIFTMRAKAQE